MPANGNETTTKFKVDVSELKKGIQEANRQIRLANAEFKAAASGMENWEKSADGISKKIEQLDKVLSSQQKILDSYEKQLEMVTKEYGENSKEADEMRIKVANQQAVVNKTAAELEKYRDALKNVQDAQDKAADGAKDQERAYDGLKDSVREQQERLNALKDEYKQVVVEQGKNSDSAKTLAKQIESLSGELRDDKKAMQDADKAADDLDKSLEESGKSAQKASDGGFTILKGALADLASKAITAVVDGLKNMAKAAADAWKEFDEGSDTVIKLTGATGDMAKSLTKSYANVSKNIVADSKDVGNAIGEINTRFKVEGKELEDLALLYLKFSDVTGSDVKGSIDDTQKALAAYGKDASSAKEFLDALAKTSQQTGVGTSTLTSGIISNATAFQEMGLSLEQAVAVMGQLETSGVNSETVLNGMRKALKSSAKDGLSLNDALLSLQRQIENGTSGMDGLNAAYDLFGKSGDQIYGAIKNGTLNFEELTKATVNASGAVEDTFNETLDATDKIQLQIQRVKVEAAELIDKFLTEHEKDVENLLDRAVTGLTKILPLVGDIAKILPTLVPVLVSLGSALAAFKIAGVITTLVTGFQKFFTVVQAGQGIMAGLNAVMAANPIGLIVAAIAALVAAFVYLWNTSEDFRNFWIGLWDGIKDAVQGVILLIKDVFEGIVNFFKKNWKTILTFLINPFAGLFKYAYEHFEGFRNFVDGIVQKIVGFFTGIVDFFKNNWQTILAFLINPFAGLFKFAYEHFEGFRNFVDGIVQSIVQFFDELAAIVSEIFEGLVKTVEILWDQVAGWFKANVIDPVVSFFTELWEKLSAMATEAWESVKNAWTAVSEWFRANVVQPVTDFFTGMWTKLKEGAAQAWEGIKNVFSKVAEFFGEKFGNAWKKVKEVFSTGGKIFDGIKEGIVDAFKTVVNAIIRGINKVVAIPFNAINSALDTIRNINIAGVKPFDGLLTRITVPEIPQLKYGGVLSKGQIGLLEGDGAEAVVPLDENKKWIAATAAELRRSLAADGLLGFGGEAGMQAGFTYTFIQNNTSPKALDRLEIYRQTKNQLALAKEV